jgi:hypothetical protein
MIGLQTPNPRQKPPRDTVPESRPGNRRLSLAALVVVGLVMAIVLIVFVMFNLSHYREMRNEAQAEKSTGAAS